MYVKSSNFAVNNGLGVKSHAVSKISIIADTKSETKNN